MKNDLLERIEEIINTLACNELQPIEVRGAFNAAINLRGALEQISESDLVKVLPETSEVIPEVKETKPMQEPTRWRVADPNPPITNTDTNSKE